MTDRPTPAVEPAADSSPDTKPVPEAFELKLPDDPNSSNDWYLWAALLALAVLVTFFPAAFGKPLWDDDHHMGLMPHFSSVNGLKELWTDRTPSGEAVTPQYYPLTFSSFWLENRIYGDSTFGYHLDNMLLHALSAILVWRILRRLGLPGAWVAAAIWAVHPLQVESVAWMTERKNCLSGLFFFISIWFYLEFAGLAGSEEERPTKTLNNRPLAYGLSLGAFVLALLSKTVTCSVPAVLLVLLWWKGRKLFSKQTLMPLVPFFLVGIGLAALTVFIENAPTGTVQAQGEDWNLSTVERFLIAGRGVWFYASKLIWPSHLTFSYPRVVPRPDLGEPRYAIQWLYLVSAIGVIGMLAAFRKSIGRGPLAAVLYYCLTLVPALGFINVYPMRYSFVADHFQYLSGLGLIVLVVVGVYHTMRRNDPDLSAAPLPAGSVKSHVGANIFLSVFVVAILCVTSALQARNYDNPRALWKDTLEKNPDSWLACDDLSALLIGEAGDMQRDAQTAAISGDPDTAKLDTQTYVDDCAEADKDLKHSLELRPDNFTAYASLGMLYRLEGRWQEAEAQLKRAVDADDLADAAHRRTQPYVDYAGVLSHNHPNIDVGYLYQEAIGLQRQTRIKDEDIGMAHLKYGAYLFTRAGAMTRTSDAHQELVDLQQAISELKLGLLAFEKDVSSQLTLAHAYERMSQLDLEAAQRARDAGDFATAATLTDKSVNEDDDGALEHYKVAIQETPNSNNPMALAGMGQVYGRQASDYQVQYGALQKLIVASKAFQNALTINPNTPGARENLRSLVGAFRGEGMKDMDHGATWAVLQPLLQQLNVAATAATGAGATANEQLALENAVVAAQPAVAATTGPLMPDHVLRPDLQQLRMEIADYNLAYKKADTSTIADRAQKLKASSDSLLAHWKNRSIPQDLASDALLACIAFGAELDADPSNATAWRDLKGASDALSQALVAYPDYPEARTMVDQVAGTLAARQSATQPTTAPSGPPAAQ